MKRAFVPAAVAVAAAVIMLGGYRCPIHLVFGVSCPTCGITRALRLVLRGDFAGATHLHPLVWLAVPVVALVAGVELHGYMRAGAWGASRRLRFANVLMLGTAMLLFALWIARLMGGFGGPVVL